MTLTTRDICEMYARVENLEQSPDAFCELLAPDARWITKRWTKNSAIGICAQLWNRLATKQAGLKHAELVSGFALENSPHIDCTVAVRFGQPDKYDTRTTFQTDGSYITQLFTYNEWLDCTWPHPQRVKHKLAELMVQDIPIAAISETPRTLVWPDRDNSQKKTNVPGQGELLRTMRSSLANALDADQKGAQIPDLSLE